MTVISAVATLQAFADGTVERDLPYLGAERTEKLEAEASPVTYFGAKTPPMLIVHGTADKVIPVEHSRELTRGLHPLIRTPSIL